MNNSSGSKKIRRPAGKSFQIFSPGWYKGEIIDSNLKEYPDGSKPSGVRETIVTDIEVRDSLGSKTVVKKFDNHSYHPKSYLSKTLQELGIEPPGPGEILDLEDFIGKKVEVRLGKTEKGGKVFNNVESLKGLPDSDVENA